MNRDAVKRAARTFIYSFLGLMLPAVLGFANDISAWAASNGQGAFPDARNLTYALVAAVMAGVIAVVNYVGVLLEDGSGKQFLR